MPDMMSHIFCQHWQILQSSATMIRSGTYGWCFRPLEVKVQSIQLLSNLSAILESSSTGHNTAHMCVCVCVCVPFMGDVHSWQGSSLATELVRDGEHEQMISDECPPTFSPLSILDNPTDKLLSHDSCAQRGFCPLNSIGSTVVIWSLG